MLGLTKHYPFCRVVSLPHETRILVSTEHVPLARIVFYPQTIKMLRSIIHEPLTKVVFSPQMTIEDVYDVKITPIPMHSPSTNFVLFPH